MDSLLIAQAGTLGIFWGVGILSLVVAAFVTVAKLIVVGNPSEMVVITGARQRDGSGYKVLIGGRKIVIPIFNKVLRLSLRNMQVALEVKAQAGGGTMMPITVTGVANVKVSSNPAERGAAIERFLGQPEQEMQRVARETLEGGLRAVIGKMTPEQIVEDRDLFVSTVMQEVSDDFRKLGMIIDSVNIQNVHDDQEYLESIARKARADVISAARKAEATRAAEAVVKEAEANASARTAKANRDAEAKLAEASSRQKAEQARYSADTAIAESQNTLRMRQAELAREAAIKEAEQQKAEAQVEQARLAATDVAKAFAERDIAKAKAEGDAASVMEEGKARASAIEQIGASIQKHPEALKVMLIEMMPSIVQELASTVKDVDLGHITVIDSGDGRAMAGAALGRARMLSESLATVESLLGIDLKALSQGIAGRMGKTAEKDAAPAPAE